MSETYGIASATINKPVLAYMTHDSDVSGHVNLVIMVKYANDFINVLSQLALREFFVTDESEVSDGVHENLSHMTRLMTMTINGLQQATTFNKSRDDVELEFFSMLVPEDIVEPILAKMEYAVSTADRYHELMQDILSPSIKMVVMSTTSNEDFRKNMRKVNKEDLDDPKTYHKIMDEEHEKHKQQRKI